MRHHSSHLRTPLFKAVSIVLISLFLLACSEGHSADDDIYASYAAAVDDAAVAEQNEVSKDLVAIVPHNENLDLRWDGEPGKSRVLVVTWMTQKTFDDYYRDDYEHRINEDYRLFEGTQVWVTAVPEMNRFLRKAGYHPATIPPLRIEQLLGMPPKSVEGEKRVFVEFWVWPKDLFRPSPDPEITDHEATVDFPTAVSRYLTYNPEALIMTWVDSADGYMNLTYVEWFENLKSISYTGPTPYPWTRLGYTYDWGRRDSHVGLSEFVLEGGADIRFNLAAPTTDYFLVTWDRDELPAPKE